MTILFGIQTTFPARRLTPFFVMRHMHACDSFSVGAQGISKAERSFENPTCISRCCRYMRDPIHLPATFNWMIVIQTLGYFTGQAWNPPRFTNMLRALRILFLLSVNTTVFSQTISSQHFAVRWNVGVTSQSDFYTNITCGPPWEQWRSWTYQHHCLSEEINNLLCT
jgi:hypothetical protein